MPKELMRGLTIRRLCETWGYTPEEALRSPMWVLRLTNLLDFVRDEYGEESPEEDGY